jgi:hypothetical protein
MSQYLQVGSPLVLEVEMAFAAAGGSNKALEATAASPSVFVWFCFIVIPWVVLAAAPQLSRYVRRPHTLAI